MKDNYVFYNNGGTIHKISESDVSEFEKDKPFAKVYMSANGKFHLIGIDEKKDFLNDFPNASFVDLEAEKAKKQKAIQPSAEQQEEEKPSLWQSISEGVVRAQNDSLGFTSNPQQTADSVEVAPETDKDMANMVIDTHNRNKEASAAYIDEIDKEYYANKPEEPKKSFWQKLGEFALNAQTNAMEFDDAYSIQQKKEDREKGQDYIDAKIAQNISSKVEDKVNEYKNPSKIFVGGNLQHVLWDENGVKAILSVRSIKIFISKKPEWWIFTMCRWMLRQRWRMN